MAEKLKKPELTKIKKPVTYTTSTAMTKYLVFLDLRYEVIICPICNPVSQYRYIVV